MIRCAHVVLSLVCLVAAAPAASADWKSELQSGIERRYKLAKLTLLRDSVREPGTLLLLVRPGIVASSDSYLANDVHVDLLANVPTLPPCENDGTRKTTLPRFQPVFVTDVLVSNSRVTLHIATSSRYVSETIDRSAIARFVAGDRVTGESVNRVDVSIRRAALVFDFGRSDLRTTHVGVVLAAIDLVLLPYDDPRAPQFGTVAIGMSRDRTLMNLGPPRNILLLGDREVLVYDRIRVTLINHEVVNIE